MSSTQIVNPAILKQLRPHKNGDCDMNDFICAFVDLGSCPSDCSDHSCGQYRDAPVCANPSTDITCSTEIYRGCILSDCADNSGNPDDKCCANLGLRPGDQIDHGWCSTQDACFGEISLCFFGDGGNPCPDCWISDIENLY